ncbi:MAG: NAD-dependent epimerase [Gemmatimonas sp. SG8_38_2]|nr:MAG: NAD-dependent epimerase [Gemmatimonas sp. SG8_38_2]
MTVLVVGATGATGRLLVEQLLKSGQDVRVIVRLPDKLPEDLKSHKRLSVIRASVLDLGDVEMARHVHGCDAVASCLGHNLTLKGMFGHPRRLVTDATRRLCCAIKTHRSARPTKFVLMNTTANSNRDLDESMSFADKCVIALLRMFLPPQKDNEKAADFLRTEIGQNDSAIEWAAVRPDGLTDESGVTEYEVHPSPIRGVIFDAGKTSRINVAHFMTALIVDDATWNEWKGKMPVIYSKTDVRDESAT